MYSDAITLHEFLTLCDDCWTGIPMRKKAVFWLMRGDRKRRSATLWINTGWKKLLDWEVNPEECMVSLQLDAPEHPIYLYERPELTEQEDGSYCFDAVAFLNKHHIGYVSQNPYKAKFRKSCGTHFNAFFAGPCGTVEYEPTHRANPTLPGTLSLRTVPEHLNICGFPTSKLELRSWYALDLALLRPLTDIPDAPQTLSAGDLTQLLMGAPQLHELSILRAGGDAVTFSPKYLTLTRFGKFWNVPFADGYPYTELLGTLTSVLGAASEQEVDALFSAAHADGLTGTIRKHDRTEKLSLPEPDIAKSHFCLNRLVAVKGSFCLFMRPIDHDGLPARIRVQVGKKEHLLALMLNPEQCLVYYLKDGCEICEPIPLTPMEDGNLLFDLPKWLTDHGIPYTPRSYQECRKHLGNPFDCWIFYK